MIPAAISIKAEDILTWLSTSGLQIVLTIVFISVARAVAYRAIDAFVKSSIKQAKGKKKHEDKDQGDSATDVDHLPIASPANVAGRHASRMLTVGSLLRSLTTFTLILVGVLTVFAVLGVPLGPLLASAGIGGVALGIGAQSLVKDFLSGLFMMIEDQYGVGDEIDTGEVTGTVQEVTLRVTRLRDDDGVMWYVRNGHIDRVGNNSQGWQSSDIDIPIAYDEDTDKARRILAQVVANFWEDPKYHGQLVSKPRVLGVQAVHAESVTLRLRIRIKNEVSGTVFRDLRERALTALQESGVKGPPIARASTFQGQDGAKGSDENLDS